MTFRGILAALFVLLVGTFVLILLFEDLDVTVLMACLQTSVGIGVSVAYFPIIWSARNGSLSAGETLAFGIFLTWIASSSLGAYTVVLQMGLVSGSSNVLSILSLLATFAGVLYLSVALSLEDRKSYRPWFRAGLLCASITGGVLLFLTLTQRPS